MSERKITIQTLFGDMEVSPLPPTLAVAQELKNVLTAYIERTERYGYTSPEELRSIAERISKAAPRFQSEASVIASAMNGNGSSSMGKAMLVGYGMEDKLAGHERVVEKVNGHKNGNHKVQVIKMI